MNQLIKIRVADIMICYPSTKDNDRELIVRFWKREMEDRVLDAKEHSQSEPFWMLDTFFHDFSQGRFTNPETIRRTRQKLQQDYKHLRGERYNARKEYQDEVKQKLGYGKTVDVKGNGYTP